MKQFLLLLLLIPLSACQFGQAVMFSRGEAGGVVEMWGGQAQYCKLTATPEVELSEAALLEFAKKCSPSE